MLRKALPSFRAGYLTKIRRTFFSTTTCRFSGRASLEESVLKALDSSTPLDAYPILQQICKIGNIVPANIMKRLYDFAATSPNPFHIHLFSSLVTVSAVGRHHFLPNLERVIKLQLAQKNFEACISLIQEVEIVNGGAIVLSYETLEALIVAAKYSGDAEFALHALKLINENYQNIFARTWGLVFQLVLDTRDYEGLKYIYKSALVPGLLVLDDASYLRMASIASQHGDLRMCEWSSLRMRRRQRALQLGVASDSLKLYIYLIESAASSSMKNTDNKFAARFQAVCRYLVRLGPLAGQVSPKDLPLSVQALIESKENSKQLAEIFETICKDQSVNGKVRTLIFNLLLSADIARSSDPLSSLQLARAAGADGVDFDEESILLLMEVAQRSNAGRKAFEALIKQNPTPRVLHRARLLAGRSST